MRNAERIGSNKNVYIHTIIIIKKIIISWSVRLSFAKRSFSIFIGEVISDFVK